MDLGQLSLGHLDGGGLLALFGGIGRGRDGIDLRGKLGAPARGSRNVRYVGRYGGYIPRSPLDALQVVGKIGLVDLRIDLEDLVVQWTRKPRGGIVSRGVLRGKLRNVGGKSGRP